jgi:hypothetical protein
MLDTLADIGRLAGRIAPAQTALGFVAQPGGRRVAGRCDFLRVFITQLVEREAAALGDSQAFRQQGGRVEAGEAQTAAQMALAIGKQRITRLENRGLQAHRGQHVLYRAARLDMHMHIPGRHQRQLASTGQLLQPGQPGRVIRPGMQLDGDPQAAGKTLGQPATFVSPLPLARHPEHQAVGKRTVGRDGIEVMAMQAVMPLVGASPGQRDEG